ncbi:Sensor histidine kinase YpdA [compost metagenome]
MIIKNSSLIAFFILVSAILGNSFYSTAQPVVKPVIVKYETKKVSLINNSYYAVSKKEYKTPNQLKTLKWHLLDTTSQDGEFADTVRQFWLNFSTISALEKDTTLILKLGNKNEESLLYELKQNQLVLVGRTGFGSRINDLSVKGDYWRINLPIRKQSVQQFYLLINKYQYNIAHQYPYLETFDTAYHEKVEELISAPVSFKNLKLWVAGFYFAVFVYCCLKFFLQRRLKSYLYCALASISLFLRYSLQVDALVMETDWLPWLNNDFIFLLSFIPQSIFYILFLSEFLQVKQSKWLNIFLKICLLQWLLMLIIMPVHFVWPEQSIITKIFWKYNALPFLVLLIWLSYYTRPKPNRGYLKFAFIGLVTLAVAFIFVVVPRWLFASASLPGWYHHLNAQYDLITLAFVVDTILFLTALAYKDRLDELERINLKIKNTENEHKILRLQMNPHFIFNCLNSINLYIEQNDSSLASDYLSKFSQLMRLSLVHSRKEKIVLTEEITALKLYLEMESMRFKGKLNYVFDIDDNVDADFIEIPPMLIQPYIENAIWHGLMHKKQGGKISIKISQDFTSQTLNITIEDNGIGRAKAGELNSKAAEKDKSYGTLITSERIAVFNKKFNANTQVHIEDLYNENKEASGTLVSINLHLV